MVRTRIAPSPTGDPHVGTAYIALFNYVFAKKHGGQFILRIEDTDQKRSTKESEDSILRALRWLGLEWDEGPYRQSERTAIYQLHAEVLVNNGSAYKCFCPAEKAGDNGYDRTCRNLSKEEIDKNAENKTPFVIRLAMPLDGETCFTDGLRGVIKFNNNTINDQILLKSDGYPTYHLASVVDDHYMEITHVIRAEEWISSTPKHVQLYKAFGWTPPEFIHMPLLRNKDKSKISKRENPVSLDYYRDAGFFPEALLNFLALMGFSFGGDREKFTLSEMIEVFDWSKVSVGEPVFDQQKLSWLNGQYLRELSDEGLLARLREWRLSDEYLLQLVTLLKERVERLDQFIPSANFFLSGEIDYTGVFDNHLPKGRDAAQVSNVLNELVTCLEEKVKNWTSTELDKACREFCEKNGWKTKELFMPIRLAVTGRTASPGLFDTMSTLGKDTTRTRLRAASKFLGAKK